MPPVTPRSEPTPPVQSRPEADRDRLKWLDPNDRGRFVRREPVVTSESPVEKVIDAIAWLTDEIFGDLSVLEQFAETTARGAAAPPGRTLRLPAEGRHLLEVERALREIAGLLRTRREAFVQEQLDALGIGPRSRGLKLHVGSGGCRVDGWLNLDAGGADLSLNVNWGLPFADGAVARLYSAHMLEHLRYADQIPAFLADVVRVLEPGGVARLVVPDLRKLLTAYANDDREFFVRRNDFYPLDDGFMNNGVANLDYVLLYCGAGPQMLNFNHKFGFDATTLCKMLRDAGFREACECGYMQSAHPELRIDDFSFDAKAETPQGARYSLFVEAVK